MSHLNTLLETKLASSDALPAQLNAELDVKQSHIDDILTNLNNFRSAVQDERDKLKTLNQAFQDTPKNATKIDRPYAS